MVSLVSHRDIGFPSEPSYRQVTRFPGNAKGSDVLTGNPRVSNGERAGCGPATSAVNYLPATRQSCTAFLGPEHAGPTVQQEQYSHAKNRGIHFPIVRPAREGSRDMKPLIQSG